MHGPSAHTAHLATSRPDDAATRPDMSKLQKQSKKSGGGFVCLLARGAGWSSCHRRGFSSGLGSLLLQLR